MDYVLTLIAAREHTSLTPATIANARDIVEGGVPEILSANEAVAIGCHTMPDLEKLRAALAGLAVDAVATPVTNQRKALLIADMDSTIVTSETLDELAAYAGLKDQIAAITRRSMNGEVDFSTALRQRVGMLKGLKLEALNRTWQTTQLTDGARALVATMRAHGALTALVSGGFTYFTSRVAALCGFDLHRANVLLDDGNALTGEVADPILDRDAKLATLLELRGVHGIAQPDTLAVGDGANDLAMIQAAGLGVAFHAKPVVSAAAQARIDHAGLRALLFIQGYRAADIKEE